MRAVKQTPVISGTKSTAMTKEEILEIRNDLYESIPTGKVDAFPLIRLISNHIDKLDALIEGATQEKQGWVKCSERLPELIEGKDYSNNVFAFDNGDIKVMCYVFIQDGDQSGYIWANCYGDINGDAEMDDEYAPTHWMPLPQKPEV